MAGGAGAIRAGGAFVEIFAKDGQFQQAMTRVQNKLKAVGTAMRSAGAGIMGAGMAIVSPMLAAAQQFGSVGGALFEMSQRTGVAAESLSVLRFAAEQTGTDMAGLETGIRKMQKSIFAASGGSKEAADALAMVGLTAADLQGLSADEQMGLIADGLMAIQDPGTRAAVAMAIFGKSGTSLLPMLEGGSAGLARFAAEAQRLGLVMDGDTAAKADALDDAIAALGASMRMAFIQIGSAVAPILTQVAGQLATAAAAAGAFIRENQKLVNVALAVGAGLTAIGGAIYGAGVAFGVVARTIGVASSAIRLLPALFTPVGLAATVAFAAVAGGIVIARALSPAFKRETDSIAQALAQLDLTTAWELMNINVAIVLTRLAKRVSDTLGGIRKMFSDAGQYIADTFGAALDAVGLGSGDSSGAKTPAATKPKTGPTWDDTLSELRSERELIRARLTPKADGPSAPQSVAGKAAVDRGVMPPGGPPSGESPTASAAGGGRSVGTFGFGEGMGIGPELNTLEDASRETAENTEQIVKELANRKEIEDKIESLRSKMGGSVLDAMPQNAGDAADARLPDNTAIGSAAQQSPVGMPAAGSVAAGAAGPAIQQAAGGVQSGMEQLTEMQKLGQAMSDGFKTLVAEAIATKNAVVANGKILEQIAKNTDKPGAAFA